MKRISPTTVAFLLGFPSIVLAHFGDLHFGDGSEYDILGGSVIMEILSFLSIIVVIVLVGYVIMGPKKPNKPSEKKLK